MSNNVVMTVVSAVSLVLLLGTLAMQFMEMQTYLMFWSEKWHEYWNSMTPITGYGVFFLFSIHFVSREYETPCWILKAGDEKMNFWLKNLFRIFLFTGFLMSISFLLISCASTAGSSEQPKPKKEKKYSNRPFNRRTQWEVNPYGSNSFRNWSLQ